MARRSANIKQKRAEKYTEKPGYSPEKKKDRKKARQRRKEKKEKQKQKQEAQKPQKPPKKQQAPKPPKEEAPLEADFLIDMLYAKIDAIDGVPIPKYSKPVSKICRKALDDFLNDVNINDSQVIDVLKETLTDPLLNRSIYESEQVQEAKQWAEELKALADHLNSTDLAEVADELQNFEDIEENEEWEEVNAEAFSLPMWMK